MADGRKAEGVLLLHGLALRPWWMHWIARDLRRAGLAPVLNWGYPRGPDLERVCAGLAARLREHFPETAPCLDVVGLSTGGLIARRLLADGALAPGGRLITLGTPHQGAAKAAWALKHLGRWATRLYGGNLRDLVPGSPFLDRLPPPPLDDMLVIYSATGSPGGKSPRVPGDDDGTVEVRSARLPGAREVRLDGLRHWFLSFSPTVRRAILAELRAARVP